MDISIKDLAKMFFIKQFYWVIDLFTIYNIKKIDICISINHRSNISIINKVFSNV